MNEESGALLIFPAFLPIIELEGTFLLVLLLEILLLPFSSTVPFFVLWHEPKTFLSALQH